MCLWRLIWGYVWSVKILPQVMEADPIIFQHTISRCMEGEKVRVVSDDTDMIFLLLLFCVSIECTSDLYICSPVAGRSIADLKITAEKNKDMTKAILVMNALILLNRE